jgi:hypothetical protein
MIVLVKGERRGGRTEEDVRPSMRRTTRERASWYLSKRGRDEDGESLGGRDTSIRTGSPA